MEHPPAGYAISRHAFPSQLVERRQAGIANQFVTNVRSRERSETPVERTPMKRSPAVALVLFLGCVSLLGLRNLERHVEAEEAAPGSGQTAAGKPAAVPDREEFAGWGTPDLAIFITGQQYGYIEPCGCTGLANQKGGLARRHTLLESLRKRNWNVVAVDAGNQVRRTGAQQEIKFQTTIDAFRAMQYAAVGLGPDDLRLSPGELAASIVASTDAEGKSDLFVSANVNPLGFVPSHRVITAGKIKVGVTGVLGKEALAKVTGSDIEKRPSIEALRESLDELKNSGSQYTILLAQAPMEECREWAKTVVGWDLIVCAEGVGEPTYQAERIPGTPTSLIQTGGKGMYAGVIGLYPNATPHVRYQRVPLDARFADSPDMLTRLASYQDTLQQQGLSGLGLQPVRHPTGKFVGSQACGECHTKAFAHWQKTPHAQATESIVHPQERSTIARHFDPECLSCHVTGWNPQGYFPYETGYVDVERSVLLHGNGCENCHGPGEAHSAAESGESAVTDADRDALRALMRLPMGQKAHDKCLECHDLDNSPDFHHDGAFEKYWEQVAHPWRD